ncbi:hypothetical protein D9M68_240850 [compost metagenome]
MVELPFQLIGKGRVQFQLVLQADAFAIGAVPGVAGGDQGIAEHAAAKGSGVQVGGFAQHAGIDVVLEALVGQLQAVVAGVVPAELGQQVVGGEVLRVGFLAGIAQAATAAEGFSFVAAAAAEVEHAVQRALAGGEGRAAQPAVVGTAVAGLEAGVGVVIFIQVVGGILGQEAHRATDGVAAVEGRGRAADDLHLLDDVRIDVIAPRIEEGAEVEGIRYGNAIHLGQHAIAAYAANGEPGQAEAAAGAAHRDARLIAHQVADVVHVLLIDIALGLRGHRVRHLVEALLAAGGGHRHGVELGCRPFGGQCEGRAEQQQGKPGSTGKGRTQRHGESPGNKGVPAADMVSPETFRLPGIRFQRYVRFFRGLFRQVVLVIAG